MIQSELIGNNKKYNGNDCIETKLNNVEKFLNEAFVQSAVNQ